MTSWRPDARPAAGWPLITRGPALGLLGLFLGTTIEPPKRRLRGWILISLGLMVLLVVLLVVVLLLLLLVIALRRVSGFMKSPLPSSNDGSAAVVMAGLKVRKSGGI